MACFQLLPDREPSDTAGAAAGETVGTPFAADQAAAARTSFAGRLVVAGTS